MYNNISYVQNNFVIIFTQTLVFCRHKAQPAYEHFLANAKYFSVRRGTTGLHSECDPILLRGEKIASGSTDPDAEHQATTTLTGVRFWMLSLTGQRDSTA